MKVKVHLPGDVNEHLEELAEKSSKTKEELIQQALEDFVRTESSKGDNECNS